MKKGIITALAAVIVLAPVQAKAQEAGIKVGTNAPPAMLETLDGRAVDLASYYGKSPVVLEFWATWCPICRQMEPAMQSARAKYAGKVAFVGVGVSANQSAERQREYVAKQKLTGDYLFDRSDAAQKAFAVPHTSYVVVIDRQGKVVYTGVGDDQDIDAAVGKAMR